MQSPYEESRAGFARMPMFPNDSEVGLAQMQSTIEESARITGSRRVLLRKKSGRAGRSVPLDLANPAD